MLTKKKQKNTNHTLELTSTISSVAFSARRYASAVYAVVVCLSVRPSVRHKPVLYRKDWTNRAGFWHEGFLPPIPHCVIRKSGYLQKLRYFPVALCPKLRYFVTSSRSRCQQNSSSSSTVELVDDTYTTIDESRLAVYWKSVDCNPLTPLWICCTTCFRIAKFHYTDTDTDPTRTKSAHVVGYELNSTTRARHGPDRTFFAAILRWVRAGPVGPV